MVWWSLSKQAMFDLTGGGSELKMAKKSFLFFRLWKNPFIFPFIYHFSEIYVISLGTIAYTCV